MSAMSQDGFLAPRRASPTSLAVVIALHAVVLGAVIVAKGPRIVPRPPVIQLIPIAPETVPDPLPPPPNPRTARPEQRPTNPLPEVTLPPLPRTGAIELPPLPPLPPIDFGPVGPAAGGETVPKAAPVMVEAAVDPRYADALQPPYPPTLARAEIEGRAIVRVLVGTDGRVKQVELVSADDPAFFEATARQARRAWRFRPATRDGVAIEGWRTMTVRFRLQA